MLFRALLSEDRNINAMEYTSAGNKVRYGGLPVCTIFAYFLFFSCEIAMAKIAGNTEQQMFKRNAKRITHYIQKIPGVSHDFLENGLNLRGIRIKKPKRRA